MRETIIAVDPGKATGVARRRSSGIIETHTFDDWRLAVAMVAASRPRTLVIERYSVLPSAPWSSHNEPMWATGALVYVAAAKGIAVHFQAPAFRNPALDEAATYNPGTDHALDACAHLLMYCRANSIDHF